ncbi:MAG: hypothetical protein UR28_C0029G0024 [Candidatus Peregrinibacteria bacterium GW2011_GWF2_33_10]|nr:MAG: hypothetical protein UR28_C0029G0024 [Candidatus Peregrinibacteria bacterium GW2011_GWF2_33_10]
MRNKILIRATFFVTMMIGYAFISILARGV